MIQTRTGGLVLLAIALVAIANHQCVQSQEQQLVAPGAGKNSTYEQTYRQAHRQNSNASETLETAPSITSVHQVWTSSSSGRLDELSPEVISKLRNDVPFLAAYALRPRLVGASPAPLISHLQPAIAAPEADGARLDVAASSKVALAAARPARQLDGRSLAKLAGDFSEYNEETSSLSKSEHHHRRKTSVKRARPEPGNSEDGPLEFSSSSVRRRRVASSGRDGDKSGDSLKQLVNRLKQRSSGGGGKAGKTNKLQKNANRNRRTGKGGSRRRPSKRSRTGKADNSRLRRAGKRRTSKSGRLLQVVGQQSKVNEEKATGGVAGDTKGGSPIGGGARKPPFYASTRPDEARGEATESPSAIDDNKLDSQPEVVGSDDSEIDEEPREVEPKVVGDDDVEEDIGDTVLVEPKSDGVDDDPPLPDDDDDDDDDEGDADGSSSEASPQDGPAGSGRGEEADRAGGREEEVTTPAPKLAPEGDPRGNRVNRQKPNPPPADDRTADDDEDNSTNGGGGGGGSQVAGGGIGTTLGGGGGSNGGPGSASDDDNQSGGGGGGGNRATPGVEFAGRDQGADDERTPTSGREGAGAGGRSAGGSSGEPATSGDGGQFGDRRQGGSGGVAGSNGGRSGSGAHDDDADDDLDYRDEMGGAERKGSEAAPADGHGRKSDSGEGGSGEPKTAVGPKLATGGGGHSPGHGHGHHCDDGSYNHEHDHGGHHAHHDTIEWLRGAIPGEPDDDYPILSRVNATNFRCADQKHPGYYADVDARCQIFHICQADGRQDSFLCPNGTIFSQRTLVCVWWNGFDCEDAPKYYHLNELLYKTTNGNESPQTAALPEAMRPLMTPLRPRSMRAREDADDDADGGASMVAPSDDGDDTSPIDGLVRAMRGRADGDGGQSTARDATGNAIGGAGPPASSNGNKAVSREEADEQAGVPRGHTNAAAPRRNLDDEDEASIQRKSTSLDDDADEPPARLRSRDNIRRRRRRASTRQAPPKLKSRRVSRNSRRRKLRHGVKPRRRA